MVLLKTPKIEKPNIRNVDLMDTYYSGDKTPAGIKKTNSPLKNFYSNKLWAALSSAMLLILITGAIIIGYSRSVKEPDETGAVSIGKAVSLKDSKNAGGRADYNYTQIRNGAETIMLAGENPFVVINFDSAMDLSNAVISFGARGETGTEKLGLILKDAKKMSNANPDDIILTTPLTENKWHLFKVSLKEMSIPIDKSRITQIRFDNSRRLTKNLPSAKVYIKDIAIE